LTTGGGGCTLKNKENGLPSPEKERKTAMENYSVLYYPHFQPSVQWLKAILLLVDDVTRIVPKDVDPGDNDQLKELTQIIPGCLKSIAPNDFDIDIDDVNMQRMNKAFREIGKNLKTVENVTVDLRIDKGISVGGHVFLHQSKVSKQIHDALIENKLLNPKLQSILRNLVTEEFYVVPIQASNLILSYIADRVARRTGLDSVTDENLPFVVNSLDNMKLSLERPTGSTEGSLLSAIASINIPNSVERIAINDYSRLRDSYAGIREAFKEYVAKLSTNQRLHRIEDIHIFENQLQDIAQKIKEECDKYQKTAFRRRFADWGLFTVCYLFPIASTIYDPTYGIAVGLEAVAIRFLKKVFFDESGPSVPDKAIKMLAGLRKRILKISTVKALS
jgi:hypothetical protein